ncbi:purine-nucleoside phosphorylase [Clostridium sp. MCC353]|uniref:purine-nucleoside phosphorylase n=1 Tax=Clostridium sp. MCC353 TaxID=2592646 RepID=UPI001C027DD8|nr:purine-nucleoside phosphorylase [Clostridium sp. MCC353]MBT9775065.1 purine-nucleoside phosphorylase [Clostridium sp. MCC353]
MSTPHNQAEKGDIAAKVLMPGDPLRAKFIAETFLEDARLVNEVRNMYAYTGTYQGHPVTVMASGMGMPSMGIYSYELFTQYGVEQIIRIGSAGAYVDELKLYDVVLADSVWSETSFARTQNGYEKDIVYPSESLNGTIVAAAEKLGIPLTLTRVHSSDVFYCEDNVDDFREINRKHQCTCVDMESFALFHNASVLGKQAACLLTISDSFTSNQKATAEERQNSFTNMMKIALEACL